MRSNFLRVKCIVCLVLLLISMAFIFTGCEKTIGFDDCFTLFDKGYYFGTDGGSLFRFLYLEATRSDLGSKQSLKWCSPILQVSEEKGIGYPTYVFNDNDQMNRAYAGMDEYGVPQLVDGILSAKAHFGTRYYFDGAELSLLDLGVKFDVAEVKVLKEIIEKNSDVTTSFSYALELVLEENAYKCGLKNVYLTFECYQKITKEWVENDGKVQYINDSQLVLKPYVTTLYLHFEDEIPPYTDNGFGTSTQISFYFIGTCGERDFPLVWFDPEIGK